MRIALRWIDDEQDTMHVFDTRGSLRGFALELVTDDGTRKRLVVAEGECDHMSQSNREGT